MSVKREIRNKKLEIRGKRGFILQQTLIHLILIGILFAVFVGVMDAKVGARGVKQQVLEKELALLIDSAEVGMSFEIRRNNVNGFIESVRVEGGRVFVGVDGLRSAVGYPYFSRYNVEVESDDSKFVVKVVG